MITVLELANEDTNLHKESSREQAGPCPGENCRCQHDGFRVKWNGKQWVFMCRGCWDSEEILTAETARAIGKLHRVGEKRGWGDSIDYVRHYRKTEDGRPFSFTAAKALVMGDTGEVPSSREPAPTREVFDYASLDWQEKISQVVPMWNSRLWGESDHQALEYARSRGLSDEISRWAKLGYSVVNGTGYLTFPSINDGRYVNVYRRAIGSVAHNERWKDIDGGCKDELYLADSLSRKLPTILVEAPICALIVLQEYGREHINCVATGGVKGGRTMRNLARLASMPVVLVAFDADQDGDLNAKYWTQRLKNSQRLRPLLKDPGDMLLDGWDIPDWIDKALYPESEVEGDELGEEIVDVCSKCGRMVEHYDANGKAYCGLHWPHQTGEQRQQWGIEQMAAIMGGCSELIRTADVTAFKERRLQELREALRARVPALPQPAQNNLCQHSQTRIRQVKNVEFLVRAPCKRPALPGMKWCSEHQYVEEIMLLGESCHYREVKISESVIILSGKHNWEAYAEHARSDILPTIKRAVKRVAGL